MAQRNKIDSNETGLRIAREDSFGVLPATPVWDPMEPNSYQDFGGEPVLVERKPINAGRQNQKGVITDLNAGGGFEQDLTQENSQTRLEEFMYADIRRKAEAGANSVPIIDVAVTVDEYTLSNLEATVVVIVGGGTSGYAVGDTVTLTGGTFSTATVLLVTSVSVGVIDGISIQTAGRYSVAPGNPVSQGSTSGSGVGTPTFTMTYAAVITLAAGDLLFASGFTDPANNGLKDIDSVTTADTVFSVSQTLVNESSPPAAADLVKVGVEATTADLDVVVSGTLPTLTSSTLDFTTLGLIPGEWIFIGGDVVSEQFVNAGNNGFARVKTIAANVLTLDKTTAAMVAETGTGLDIRLFLGRVLKNESDPTLIRRFSVQMERQLGAPDDALPAEIQAEYLTGSVPNEFAFQIPTADKLVTTLSYLSGDSETIDGPTALKSGTRPTLVSGDAYNTSSDVSSIKMNIIDPASSTPSALFAFITELNLNINNGAQLNKAVGVLGACGVTVGNFVVTGELTAYFSQVAAVNAVRNNSDITLHAHLAKANSGISIDIPLIALGDGRVTVEQDEPITLPLSLAAATAAKIDANMDHTLLLMFWEYLPTAAES